MKAQHVNGYDDKWLINLDPNPWNPRTVVYRINGIAQTYDTEEQANAVIARLKALGEQGALDHYTKDRPSPDQPEQHFDPNPVPKRVKRG